MPIADTGNERIYIPQLRATRWTGCCTINTGMTKYRKGPTKDLQRTAKEHYTGPQRIGNHEKTARLATFLFNFLKLFCLFFCNFVFFCVFFVNFGVLMNYGGLRNNHFATPAQINQSFCFLFCAVGTWSTTTSQFLPSIWILDGAGRSGCHQ